MKGNQTELWVQNFGCSCNLFTSTKAVNSWIAILAKALEDHGVWDPPKVVEVDASECLHPPLFVANTSNDLPKIRVGNMAVSWCGKAPGTLRANFDSTESAEPWRVPNLPKCWFCSFSVYVKTSSSYRFDDGTAGTMSDHVSSYRPKFPTKAPLNPRLYKYVWIVRIMWVKTALALPCPLKRHSEYIVQLDTLWWTNIAMENGYL